MCLIAIAHLASARWPLVIAANRDEFFDRPARAAHGWEDAPDVLGGRDLRAGGSWLAVTRGGRFAMVTNVRGLPEPPDAPSRGALVADFVRSTSAPLAFAEQVARPRYAGFHLVAGEVGGVVAHVSSDMAARALEPGIFAVSNAPAAIDWPKIAFARQAMERALASDNLEEELMRFLTTPRGGPIESEVFVAIPEMGYGTRASTVVIASADGTLDFTEQTAAAATRFRLR
ncbi:MAG: NRDE family protein [Acidobacteriota bacterium]